MWKSYVRTAIVTIFITLIAILVLASFRDDETVTRRFKERSLRENLVLIQRAINQFTADTGKIPVVIEDIQAPSENFLITHVNSHSYKGPYLTPSGGIRTDKWPGLPRNPFVDPCDGAVAHHWKYNPADGTVQSALNSQ
jgi:hypothetical protein